MKKRNILLSSICSIMLCLSIVLGATYALFTSTKSVNVAVTSGKVEVYAYARNEDLTSTLGYNLPETSITIDENEVVIDKIVPGDVFTFEIVVENHSNVTIQYSTVITLVEGYELFKGLEVTIDNTVFNSVTAYSKWVELQPISGEDKTYAVVPVKITLPEEAGDEYQDKTARLSYTVNAVQGNAPVVDPFTLTVDGTEVETFVSLNDAIAYIDNATVTAPTEFVLTVREGTYYDVNMVIDQTVNKNVTIKAQDGKTVTFLNSNNAVPVFYIDGNSKLPAESLETVTFEGLTFELNNTAYGVQFGSGNTARYAHNITLNNCNFVGDGTGYGVQSGSNSSARNVVISGGNVDGVDTYVSAYCESLTVSNVTAENINGFVNNSNGLSTVTIDTCTVNVNGPEAGYVARNQGDGQAITITNSTLSLTNNLNVASAVVVARGNTELTMSNNTITINGAHTFDICAVKTLTVSSDVAYSVANGYKTTTYTVTNYDAANNVL
ncbi:MAG: hypothetical protein IJZ77_05345 [Bacilli bacterium]|nr:hypothetical protein [Bacilli bacterium]MBQ8425019.1 hypothetical protein [Clostridia bacterium]